VEGNQLTQPAADLEFTSETIASNKARNAHTSPQELQAMIDEAVRDVRAGRGSKGSADSA
jgi:hypothetical protein